MKKLFGNLNIIVKHACRLYSVSVKLKNHVISKEPPWKILFFGSDEFSLYSLKALLNECKKGIGVFSGVEVVTCSQINPIWKFSKENQLTIRDWPPDMKKGDYDLGLVVSFGHLIPEDIISKFPLGMLNVHASLLPRWRGASPIVYALANGDKETGVTIMTIKPKKFDVGEILHQEKIPIPPEMEMPELHAKLGNLGANCLIETIKNLNERLTHCKPQPKEGATYARKITPQFAQINWNKLTAGDVYNLQRALKSVQPLKTMWNSVPVKLFDIAIWPEIRECILPGHVEYSRKHKLLIIECANKTWISVQRVGVQGKRVMSAADFYNGFITKLDRNTVACYR